MGKRSDFEPEDRHYYPTPYSAVVPLLSFLPMRSRYVEPCAGNMALVRHLQGEGHSCSFMCDWEPQDGLIKKMNALDLSAFHLNGADYIITNPPWGRDLLHPMIRCFSRLLPTWLLFDSDLAYTVQAAPFLERCELIVAVGRVKWIDGTDSVGKDNCSWYKFVDRAVQTRFVGKKEKQKCYKTKDLFKKPSKENGWINA